MKTKRIVALALASALALGAVATPVLAAPAATEVNGLTSSEAYAKIVAAQLEVINEAQKKFNDAKANEAKKAQEWEDAKEAVKDAKLEAIEAQQKIDAANNQIDYWTKKQKENRDNKDALELDYAEEFGLGNVLESEDAYDRAIELANKEGNADLEAKLTAAKQWFIDNDIAKLNANDKYYAKSIESKKDELIGLNQTKDFKDLLVKEAEEAEKAAQLAWAQAFQDMETLEDELNLRNVELDKIKTFQRKATEEMIKGETNPKLAELAAKDYVAYWLAKLVYDEEVLLPETVKKLNLGEEILKQYHDILGDEETIEPQESESDKTEEPTPEPKPEPKPEPQPDVKPDTKPDVKPEDKKDDKKVAPKTGDIAVLAYAGSAVLAAGAFVASKKRK